MEGLKVILECIYQVNIELGYYDGDDVWNVEKGEKIEGKIFDDGIRLKVDEDYWSTKFKPSILQRYFKIIG